MTAATRVWKFGDDINTDLIIPGKHLDNYDPSHLASHAMEGVSKSFAKEVRHGDIIVAGKNFGCGSSREQAVVAIKHSGVSAVVAKSFARIFYRNAINLGLPVLVSAEAADSLQEGQMVEFDRTSLTLTANGAQVRVDPVPSHVKAILDEGGLIPFVKIKLKEREIRSSTSEHY